MAFLELREELGVERRSSAVAEQEFVSSCVIGYIAWMLVGLRIPRVSGHDVLQVDLLLQRHDGRKFEY